MLRSYLFDFCYNPSVSPCLFWVLRSEWRPCVWGLWCCLLRFSVTCIYAHIRCSRREGQSLSSEVTCWLDTEQHVETASNRKGTGICDRMLQDKKKTPNRQNSVLTRKMLSNLLVYVQVVSHAISIFTFETFTLFSSSTNLLIVCCWLISFVYKMPVTMSTGFSSAHHQFRNFAYIMSKETKSRLSQRISTNLTEHLVPTFDTWLFQCGSSQRLAQLLGPFTSILIHVLLSFTFLCNYKLIIYCFTRYEIFVSVFVRANEWTAPCVTG